MAGVNKVILVGRVCSDPELKHTNGGVAFLTFSLATNYRVKKNDEWVEQTTFHNIVVWAKFAESLHGYLKKGTRLYLEGQLVVRSWEAEDGSKRYKTEIKMNVVTLLSNYVKKSDQEQGQTVSTDEAFDEVMEEKEQKEQKKDNEQEDDPLEDQELPF